MLIALLFYALLTGCTGNPVVETFTASVAKEGLVAKEEAVAEQKLKNPYSVANMREAYNHLEKAAGAGLVGRMKVEDTKTRHRYIKFMPRNERRE